MGSKPGPPPPNEPSAFEFLQDNRLIHNPNITRMPTNQQEWGTFIQELSKLVKNETGSFDVGGSATAQFTGFSTDPATANIWYHRFGQMVHMEFHFTTGTSDTQNFTITGIPEVIRPRDTTLVLVGAMRDNGADLTATSSVAVGSDGTLTFYKTFNAATNSWTASNAKGFNVQDPPNVSIIYSLRQPGKH